MLEFKIGSHRVGPGNAPFVIGEMSGNHNQSLDRALALVEVAAKAGVHALKLQTYTPDTMTIDVKDGDFFIADKKSLWDGSSLYDLYKRAMTPWEWHRPIFERCRELGMIGFSTPFDSTAVDLLESLEVPVYKIASFENTDLPLIRRVARTGKPMIISTGMATLAEIEEAVTTAREAGAKHIVLLKCTSNYPADPSQSHLATIPHLRDAFGVQVGISDHTLGIGAAVCAVALGATVIEKHFTMDRKDGGVDSQFSLEPHELKLLVSETAVAARAVGSVHYGPSDDDRASLRFRRSIYVTRDMKAGEVLSEQNIRIIRPGFGLAPKFWDEVVGKHVSKDIVRGTGLKWSHLG